MDDATRRRFLAALGGATALAGCVGTGDGGDGGDSTPVATERTDTDTDGADGAAAWRATELTDVRDETTFAIADLERPVLLQTFAVWCSKCQRQQEAIKTLIARRDDVTPVNLNVDPNEDAGRVRSHLREHGFDWRYAVSPPSVTDSLVDRFGSSITVPPKSPIVVVCEDEASRLSDGVKSADQLESALSNCPSV